MAASLIYEGLLEPALELVRAARSRHDGEKRNPWDEPECGHHYARAMVSWGALLALTGFHYSAITQTLEFAAESGYFFWSNGYAWGTVLIVKTDTTASVELKINQGNRKVKKNHILSCQYLVNQYVENKKWKKSNEYSKKI